MREPPDYTRNESAPDIAIGGTGQDIRNVNNKKTQMTC